MIATKIKKILLTLNVAANRYILFIEILRYESIFQED